MTNVKMSMNPFCEIAVEVGRYANRTESILLPADLLCSNIHITAANLCSAGGSQAEGKEACRGGISRHLRPKSMPGIFWRK